MIQTWQLLCMTQTCFSSNVVCQSNGNKNSSVQPRGLFADCCKRLYFYNSLFLLFLSYFSLISLFFSLLSLFPSSTSSFFPSSRFLSFLSFSSLFFLLSVPSHYLNCVNGVMYASYLITSHFLTCIVNTLW